jgi:pyrroline-5-carboxylate reductase
MKLGFIGGGLMGEAILAGAIDKKIAGPDSIAVAEIMAKRRDHLSKTHGVQVAGEPDAALGADIVVLAVKPQEFAKASGPLSGRLKSDQTVMSIMAGVRIETIQKALGHDAVARAIPNTAAQVGESMTVWTASTDVSEGAKESVRNVLAVLGQELYVADEKYVDMATAVSSSGPAYIFLVMEAMIDAAVHIGLRRDQAEAMVKQTIYGSALYARESGRHPAVLRNEVTSPGGTTAEALRVLEEAAVRAAFTDAIEAAFDKAKQLGE